MNTLIKTATSRPTYLVLGTLLCSMIFTSFARADESHVLPPTARPHGYSLAEAAAATAHFNTGPRNAESLPSNFPFQILYFPSNGDTTFLVRPHTAFYVPVVYSDDTDATLWPYPNVRDARAVSDYYFNPNQLGAEFIQVVVDGEVTRLGRRYATGAVTPGLPSGGNNYTVVAVFLTPLSRGTHTVKIQSRFTGGFIDMYPDFFPGGVFASEVSYTVIVGH